jgi:hypothetical protein
MVKQSFQVLLLSLVIFISLAATPLLGQDSRYAFEGGWTIGVEFSSSIQSVRTSCSGLINLLIRDGKAYGDWTVRASDADASNPYSCDYATGSISGEPWTDGAVELELYVERKVTEGGMTTFEYVPWLQDFSEGSSCPVTQDTPWVGALEGERLTIRATARCTLQGRSLSVTYSLRFDGSAQ